MVLLIGIMAVLSLLNAASSQTSTSGSDIHAEVAQLKLMVGSLQQQVGAIHGTLLTQQTMSINDVCKLISTTPTMTDPVDCTDVQLAGHSQSGVYTVKPAAMSSGIEVYCDMDTDGGGWTQIQKRMDGTVEFYKTYGEYETGFGNLTGEHYLGNSKIHAITSGGTYELRVELEDYQQHVKTAHYSTFSVGDNTSKYTLHVDGYNGTAGDSLKFDHDGHAFSAHDADSDGSTNANCAENHHGGYWYSSCFKSNLNGKWGVPGEQGIIWGSYKDWQLYVLKRTEMKIRRKK